MGWYAANDGSIRSKGTMYFVLHPARAEHVRPVDRPGREHPYEVPDVSARPIIDGNPDYLARITKATGTPSAA